jgi:hypothetical protein
MSATTPATAPVQPTRQPKEIVRTCPYCGHHTLVARGQSLHCRSCQQAIWRSES